MWYSLKVKKLASYYHEVGLVGRQFVSVGMHNLYFRKM